MATLIILLILIAFVAGTAWHYYNVKKKEAVLRLEPPPLSWMNCALPADYQDSQARMVNFYGKLSEVCKNDRELREHGQGVIHLAWITEKVEGARVPEARFYIGCQPDAVDAVRSRLQSSYGLDLTVQSLKESPLVEEIAKAQAAAPIELPFSRLRELFSNMGNSDDEGEVAVAHEEDPGFNPRP